MLFSRRRRPHPILWLREFAWPRAGWRRRITYIAYRIVRMRGTAYAIAAGFACGAAVSFTPFIGFHFLLAALISWVIGASVIASAIGTAVGNPWTFPFIWLWTLHLGNWILGVAGHPLPNDLTLRYIFDNPLGVLWPMVIGGVPTGIAVGIGFYWPLRSVIRSYRRHRGAHGGARLNLWAARRRR